MKKIDDVAADRSSGIGALARAALFSSSPLYWPFVVAAGLLCSFLFYDRTLKPLKDPEEIHHSLGDLILYMGLSSLAFAASVLVYLRGLTLPHQQQHLRFTRAVLSWPAMAVGQRAGLWVLRTAPVLFILFLALRDFGTDLEHHGQYNLALFVAFAFPSVAVLLTVEKLVAAIDAGKIKRALQAGEQDALGKRELRGLLLARSKVILFIVVVVLPFLRYWSAHLDRLNEEWRMSVIPGVELDDRDDNCNFPLSSSVWVPLLDSPSFRSINRLITGLPQISKPLSSRALAASAPPGSVHTEGFASLSRFESLLSPFCPPPSMPLDKFKVERVAPARAAELLKEALKGQGAEAFKPLLEELERAVKDAASFDEDALERSSASSPSCDPRDSSMYLPVTLRVRCPANLPLRYRLPPKDPRLLKAEPKHGEGKLQRAVFTSQPWISAPPRLAKTADGVVYSHSFEGPLQEGETFLVLPSRLFGESLEVACGGDLLQPKEDLEDKDGSTLAVVEVASPLDGGVVLTRGEISAEGEREYASFARPRRDVLIRLRRWWRESKYHHLSVPHSASSASSSSPSSSSSSRQRSKKRAGSKKGLGNDIESGRPRPPNVLHILIDTVSRNHAKRMLPLTLSFLRELHLKREQEALLRRPASLSQGMEVVELMRLHSNGRSTGPNVGVLFTGEWDAHPGRETLWEAAMRRAGYVGAMAAGMCEDWSSEYMQFSTQSDHEPSAMFCAPKAYPLESPTSLVSGGPFSSRPRCMRGRHVHERSMDWAKSFWRAYSSSSSASAPAAWSSAFSAGFDAPKWLTMTFLEGHESTGEVLATLDKDMRDFLRFVLLDQGGARDTVVVLQSDHGLHMGLPYLLTKQGRIEHMNPVGFLLLPSADAMPGLSFSARERLKRNALGLTTHSDIYHTLRDVMTLAVGGAGEEQGSEGEGQEQGEGALEMKIGDDKNDRLPTPLEMPPNGAVVWQPMRSPRCEADMPDVRYRPDRSHTQFVPSIDTPEGFSPVAVPKSWGRLVMRGYSLFGVQPRRSPFRQPVRVLNAGDVTQDVNDDNNDDSNVGGAASATGTVVAPAEPAPESKLRRTCADAGIPAELCYCS